MTGNHSFTLFVSQKKNVKTTRKHLSTETILQTICNFYLCLGHDQRGFSARGKPLGSISNLISGQIFPSRILRAYHDPGVPMNVCAIDMIDSSLL